MNRYLLRIKLLSDMCVSDGGVYNSALDTDICHDRYGFPYIPAKRIKGCLRECGLELNEWGMNLPLGEMFGDTGRYSNGAKVRIGNAYLEEYEVKKSYVRNAAENLVFHQQNILNHFSYIRVQTALDPETGAADPTTLRSMRVAKKGLVFESLIEADEVYQKALEACCDIFTNIGIARTRGLGEIQANLIPYQPKQENERTENERTEHAAYTEHAVRLDYELYLEEPMICKSVTGGESRTLDYIEGSKMLGLIAQEIKKRQKDFEDFMSAGELFCSNAYPAHEGRRCTEVPAAVYSVKNNDAVYVNQLYPLPEEWKQKQLNRMKHCYILEDGQGNLIRKNVRIEERYHHRRPEDKSIGRAAKEPSGNSQFYQMSSIEAGQSFRGYVTGTEKQIRQIYEYICGQDIFYLGYSRSSEYGKTKIRVTDMSCRKEPERVTVNEWIVKLEAPALVYNDRAFYSTDIKDLDAEIRAILGLPWDKNKDDIGIETDHFVNYTAIGGYNVTWDARKPVAEVFDKGTVLRYRTKRPVELEVPEVLLVGERVCEGFGEAVVYTADREGRMQPLGIIISAEEAAGDETADVGAFAFAKDICDELYEDYIQIAAAMDVKALPDKGDPHFKVTEQNKDLAALKSLNARATVSNMLLMCQQNSSLEEISKTTEQRYGKASDKKEAKLKIADTILSETRKNSAGLLKRFCEKYRISGYTYDQDRCGRIYLAAYLQQLKYIFRKKENMQRDKEGEANE